MNETTSAAPTPAPGASVFMQSEAYVDTGDALLYVKRIGAGHPLLLLHGGPGASHDYLVRPLLPLARTRELIFFDQRGCGRSSSPASAGGYTMARMVDDIERVRQALELPTMDLFGHSFGGFLAQAYAVAHPSRLHALLLAGTVSSAADADRDFARVKRSAPAEVLQQIEALEAQGIYDADGAQLQAYRQLCDSVLKPFMYASRPPAWDTPGSAYGWDAMRLLWGGQSDFRLTGDAKGFDFLPQLRELRLPTLVIYGSHDMISDESAMATHQAVSGSRLLRLENAGHEMYVDQPAAFFAAVQSFLESHAPAQAAL